MPVDAVLPATSPSAKPSAKRGSGKRKFNPLRPPAIAGYKWSPNGAGFDCKKFSTRVGKTTEIFVGYLGKKKLAEMRLESEDKDELRQLVKAWIAEKEAAKGKLLARVSTPKQKQNRRQEDSDLQ